MAQVTGNGEEAIQGCGYWEACFIESHKLMRAVSHCPRDVPGNTSLTPGQPLHARTSWSQEIALV